MAACNGTDCVVMATRDMLLVLWRSAAVLPSLLGLQVRVEQAQCWQRCIIHR